MSTRYPDRFLPHSDLEEWNHRLDVLRELEKEMKVDFSREIDVAEYQIWKCELQQCGIVIVETICEPS